MYYVSKKDDIALEILIEKYCPLIKKKLKDYKISPRFYEDFYQECILLLYECVKKYNPNRNSSFNHYFQVYLNFNIQNMLKKNNNYFSKIQIMDDVILDSTFHQETEYEFESKLDKAIQSLSEEERILYEEYSTGIAITKIANKREEDYMETYNKIKNIKVKINDNEKHKKGSMSLLEKNVFEYYKSGYHPKEISLMLEMDISVIYNALKRAKKKNGANK